MKAIAQAYATKMECSVQKAVYLVMPEIWLLKIFSKVILLKGNLPEKEYKIFKQKNEIDELPDDSTDFFQSNMLDRYLNRPSESLKNCSDKVIDKLCFEFLSYHYIVKKPV